MLPDPKPQTKLDTVEGPPPVSEQKADSVSSDVASAPQEDECKVIAGIGYDDPPVDYELDSEEPVNRTHTSMRRNVVHSDSEEGEIHGTTRSLKPSGSRESLERESSDVSSGSSSSSEYETSPDPESTSESESSSSASSSSTDRRKRKKSTRQVTSTPKAKGSVE